MTRDDPEAAGDGPMKKTATAAMALALTTPVEAQERRSVAPEAMQKRAPALAGYTDNVLLRPARKRCGKRSPRSHPSSPS
jgi:4-carboxymuconolactone decarboxylase